MEALLYRRVSTDHQDHSLELQEHDNDEYCRRLGLNIVASFSDPDTSGSVFFDKRPGGHALLQRLAQGGIQHIVTYKQDRMGRDTLDAIDTIRRIWNLSITPHFVAEGGALPWNSHNQLQFEMKASFANYELNLIRDRTRAVARRLFSRGLLTGKVPFGYDALYTFADGSTLSSQLALAAKDLPKPPITKQLVVNEAELATLRQIKAWRDTGWTLNQIASALNSMGVHSKVPAGTQLHRKGGEPYIASGQWGAGNVAAVLKSRHSAKLLTEPPDELSSAA